MKISILAEKPSVAREIASIVGANNKEDGFLTGNNYMVTWALGHLVQLAMPEDYGFTGFVKENLPIIPETFILKPRQIKDGKEYKTDSGALRQLKIINHVFDSCDRIIVATNAGRGVFSLGRVQTPTLAMICKRFLENKNFVSVPLRCFACYRTKKR
jgi:DNA topoisomerase-3